MIGVDEVGRGCLAGPLLVVAARARDELPPGLKDSKRLSRSQRQSFYPVLLAACDFGEGWVSAAEINKYGLGKCLALGVARSLKHLNAVADEDIIMDGICNYIPKKYTNRRCEAKADNNYPIVSAASIIAKVRRDKYMADLAIKHPNYYFEKHVGYGTRQHYEALKTYGPLKFIHRTVFLPRTEPA